MGIVLLGESITHQRTIFLLLAHPLNELNYTYTFTIINK